MRVLRVCLVVLYLECLARIHAPAASTRARRPCRSAGTTRLAGATGTTRPRGSGGTAELLIVSMFRPWCARILSSWKRGPSPCLSVAPVATTTTAEVCLLVLVGTRGPGRAPAVPGHGPGIAIWHLTCGTWTGRTWSPARSLTTTKDGSSQSLAQQACFMALLAKVLWIGAMLGTLRLALT